MGQFYRVVFKQSGESLFDSLFEFNRQLKETMAYAIIQKNGNLNELMQMQVNKPKMVEYYAESTDQKQGIIQLTSVVELPLDSFTAPVSIALRDDFDDEAVYGRNRHRKMPAGTINR